MPRYKKQIWAGDVYECEEYFSPRTIGAKHQRGQSELLTTEEQKERNLRIARKKLTRQINANFKKGDLFLTLTYRERISYKDAKKELSKFLRKLKNYRKKNGMEGLKYISVTEAETGREHHHLLINGMGVGIKELTDLWGLGRVMASQLEPGGDYTGLARYITKETMEPNAKRWNNSRNLEKPKILVKKMKSLVPKKRQKPPKGYVEKERSEYFSEEIGAIRYLKAVRIGGEDYGEGRM